MSVLRCNIDGFKYYYGGWVPSNDYYAGINQYSGYAGTVNGNTAICVYRVRVPSHISLSNLKSLTFTIRFNANLGSSFNIRYYVTTAGPANGTTSTATQGTVLLSGTWAGNVSSSGTTLSITTGNTTAIPDAGTVVYLWLRDGTAPVEMYGGGIGELNYEEDTTPAYEKTIKASSSYERNQGASGSWAQYSYDADGIAYDGGYRVRVGGYNSSMNWYAWYNFPTGSSVLDTSLYYLSSAEFQIFQAWWESGMDSSGTVRGTVQFDFGNLTPSGTNSITNIQQTVTATTVPTNGIWYDGINVTEGAQALINNTANGVFLSLLNKPSSLWYSSFVYNGGNTYYPRILLRYRNKAFNLTVASATGGTASGSGSYRWGSQVTVIATPATGYRFVRWELSGGSTATSTNATYTFTMPQGNTTATPVFARNTFTITVGKQTNATGDFSVSGGGTYDYNEELKLEVLHAIQ